MLFVCFVMFRVALRLVDVRRDVVACFVVLRCVACVVLFCDCCDVMMCLLLFALC